MPPGTNVEFANLVKIGVSGVPDWKTLSHREAVLPFSNQGSR